MIQRRAESYDFARTDEYLAAIRTTGSDFVYRLGESIEHTRIKRFVHPPKDPERWAAIALGIIRHYNEAWANGVRYNIRYWEIWNEPENRPAMWTGSDDDYFRLYRAAARAIRSRYPHLKVGGPSVGHTGEWAQTDWQPSAFVSAFLDFCRREGLPLDFFSWHCYAADPRELVARAKAIRRLLDRKGFARTESHLNEWNYLPGNTWEPMLPANPPAARQNFYGQMSGAPGAAFVASALLELQDAPVDMCNLFHGELGAFGLFSPEGVPLKNFDALRAFSKLLETPDRVNVRGSITGQLSWAAGISADRTRASVLISNFAHPGNDFRLSLLNLPWSLQTIRSLRIMDGTRGFDAVHREIMGTGSAAATVSLELKAPAIALIELQPAETP